MTEDDRIILAAESMVCPQCLALSAADEPECRQCRLVFDWLAGVPTFREVLRATSEHWSLDLQLHVSWHGGESEIRKPWNEVLEIVSGEGAPWSFRTVGPPYEVEAECGERLVRIPLPGEATLDTLRVSARLTAVSKLGDGVPKLADFSPRVIELDQPAGVILGSEISDAVHEVADTDVALRHCIVVCQPKINSHWIADLGSASGTFVNRRRVVVARLKGGDFLQIGKRAWIYNESDGLLVPVQPIDGTDLRLEGVGLASRLVPLDLHVPPGQLVAIAGASGAGKSTLIRAVLGAPHSRTQGSVSAGGHDCDDQREEYRRQLGYVSQGDVVHADLKALETIDFSASLREKRTTKDAVSDLLRRLDLRSDLWHKTPSEMSGGEAQRVRIAAELIADPQILLLDEPAKGLDQGREIALLTLLRGLSFQGCTVVVITHGLGHLEFFDRVLLFVKTSAGGQLRFDGTPEQLRTHIPSAEFTDLNLADPPEQAPSGTLPTHASEEPSVALSTTLRHMWDRGVSQLKLLFRREMVIAANAKIRRIWLPLFVVPLIFAISIGLAIPATDLARLGFFAILASIWMGSSLSLMSIVNERLILNHERLLFLRLTPYIVGKCCILWVFSAFQTVVFLLILSLVRAGHVDDGMLHDTVWVTFYLVLVGWASVGLGLVISAFSGSKAVVANFILPLVIMVQIVFSVQVAGSGSNRVDLAYGKFNARSCGGRKNCPRRVEHRVPGTWVFLCNKCSVNVTDKETWQRLRNGEASKEPGNDADVVEYNQKLPSRWAARASVFTLSRYGDMALSCFAYGDTAPDTYQEKDFASWRFSAVTRLAQMIIGLPLVALAILWWQTTGASIFFVDLANLLAAGDFKQAEQVIRAHVAKRFAKAEIEPPVTPSG